MTVLFICSGCSGSSDLKAILLSEGSFRLKIHNHLIVMFYYFVLLFSCMWILWLIVNLWSSSIVSSLYQQFNKTTNYISMCSHLFKQGLMILGIYYAMAYFKCYEIIWNVKSETRNWFSSVISNSFFWNTQKLSIQLSRFCLTSRKAMDFSGPKFKFWHLFTLSVSSWHDVLQLSVVAK